MARSLQASGEGIRGHGFYKNFESGPEAALCAQIAEVEVDVETGQVTVKQFTTAHSTGTVLNPLMHQGQIDGGVVMGIGYALMEEVMIDGGKVMTTNFGDSKIPSIMDIPPLKTVHSGKPGGQRSLWRDEHRRAAGDSDRAAIANAVHDAVGVRIYDLPITAEKVLWALRGKTGLMEYWSHGIVGPDLTQALHHSNCSSRTPLRQIILLANSNCRSMTDELAKRIVQGLKDAGINFVTYLPETRLSQIVPLIRDDPEMELIAAASEQEAVTIAAGATLGGKQAAVYMENTGIYVSSYSLLAVGKQLGVPILLIVGFLGGIPDQRNSFLYATIGNHTIPVLQGLGIEHMLLEDGDRLEIKIKDAVRGMNALRAPFALLFAGEFSL